MTYNRVHGRGGHDFFKICKMSLGEEKNGQYIMCMVQIRVEKNINVNN